MATRIHRSSTELLNAFSGRTRYWRLTNLVPTRSVLSRSLSSRDLVKGCNRTPHRVTGRPEGQHTEHCRLRSFELPCRPPASSTPRTQQSHHGSGLIFALAYRFHKMMPIEVSPHIPGHPRKRHFN